MFKSVSAIAALSVASLAFASPASAHLLLLPANHAFTANGGFAVTVGVVTLPCTMQGAGMTHDADDSASLSSAKFSGLACGLLTASGLPWAVSPSGLATAKIVGVSVSALVIGVCGPGNLIATVTPTSGVFTITGGALPGTVLPCSVSSTFVTVPHLHIKP